MTDTANLITPDSAIELWDASPYPTVEKYRASIQQVYGYTARDGRLDRYTDNDFADFMSVHNLKSASAFEKNHTRLFGHIPSTLKNRYKPHTDDGWIDILASDELKVARIYGALDARNVLSLIMWMYANGDMTKPADDFSKHIIPESPVLGFKASVDDEGITVFELYLCMSPYTELLAKYSMEDSNASRWCFSYYPYPKSKGDSFCDFTSGVPFQSFNPVGLNGIMGLYGTYKAGNVTRQQIADDLMTLHLTGIRTAVHGMRECRKAENGISALWWKAFDQFSGRRIFQCEACRKVSIAEKQPRAHIKRFCSDACKQWRAKHRSKDESGNYVEWLPPRQ